MTTTNIETPAPAQIENVARTLTNEAEAGHRIDQELNNMNPTERTEIARKMQEYNNADRDTNHHLPKIDFAFENTAEPSDSKHFGGLMPNVVFKATGPEVVTNMTIEKDPDALFFKDKEVVYDIKDRSAFMSEKDQGKELEALFEKMNEPLLAKQIEEKFNERQKLVDELTPAQRQEYNKEIENQIAWEHSMNVDPIAFSDRRPAMPLHDEIERKTNASGQSDSEEMAAAREKRVDEQAKRERV